MHIRRTLQSLIVVLAFVAASCGSGTTALDTGAAETVGADSGVQLLEDVAEQYPFLDYVTTDDPDALHPGAALFVLVDESGGLVLEGPDNFPAYGISIDVWAGVDVPFVSTLGYSNYQVEANGSLGRASRCGGFSGNFEQLAPDQYLFQGDRFPQIQGSDLAWESDGCPPPPVQQEQIFSAAVEIEFDDEAITIISSDGTRWRFRQYHDDSEAQAAQPAETTTTFVDTTTTTTTEAEAPDPESAGSTEAASSFGLPGVITPVECVQTGWMEFRTTLDWQPNADAEPVDLYVGVVFPGGGDQALGGGLTTLRLDEPGPISWEYTIDSGFEPSDFFVAQRDPMGEATCVVTAPELEPDAFWLIEEITAEPPPPTVTGETSELSEFLASISFAENDALIALAYLEDQGGFALFNEFALVEGPLLENVSASRLDGCIVTESIYQGQPQRIVAQSFGCDGVVSDLSSPSGAWSVNLTGFEPGDLRWFEVADGADPTTGGE